MDEYDKKFAEMQKYIPFLEAMIERLQNVKDKSREFQLQKMQGLHGILSDNKRKLKIETLQRCEDVLQKLHSRVEKGNAPGLQLPAKQNDVITLQPSILLEDAKSDQNDQVEQNAEKVIDLDETPASPDPSGSSSPDCQILPIVIPTERSTNLLREKCDRRQTKSNIIPVITLTDNNTRSSESPVDSNMDDVMFNEWEMLEESHNAKNKSDWKSVTSDNDVAIAAKLVSSNLPQKVNDGSRNYALGSRSVPVPSRFPSVLEKNKLNVDISEESLSRPESPVNVPEVRLNSPDPEILFARPRVTSPRLKDNYNVPKTVSIPPSIPLLLSPPASSKPPLSMEDLAKLLNDEGEAEKKGDKADEDITKHKNDSSKHEMSLVNKDGKTTKNLSSDAVRESEKRWEEVNNHNIKFTTRKSISNIGATSVVKLNEMKRPPFPSNDHRSAPQVSSPGSKFQEPRYADNYEKHPRQRDVHGYEGVKDKLVVPNAAVETSPQIHLNVMNKPDERSNSLYQRRPSVVPSEGWKDTVTPSRSESEFVIEGIDYYNMNQMHWPSSGTTGDNQFNNAQWTSPPVYGGISNPSLQPPAQHSYQHPMEPQFRPNQFPSNLPAGPRPLISPAVRPQDINHAARPENIREDILPLRSTPGFPVTPQYRGFQIQGSYDQAFDRPSVDYAHGRPTWNESANRASDVTYENIIPCGIQTAENSTISYPRPNTPCPWGSRDNRCNRGRGRDTYYNDRSRTEVRPNFNRDVRRSDWPRDGHSDRENPPNRFANRDPRVRTSTDHNVTSSSQAKETSASVRDPRLAKDKHVNTPVKAKDTVQNERDPRKRPPFNSTVKTTTPTKEKSKLKKSEKEKVDKLPKDRMQSPLESLYGAIDTTKSCQGSGLQKFRIPKIKRSESLQPTSITNESKRSGITSSKLPRAKSNSKKSNVLNSSRSENIGKEDTNAEVSSSSDNTTESFSQLRQNDVSSFVEETNRNEIKIGEADSVTNDSKSSDIATDEGKKDESEADGAKFKEEVTQEWVEALIRKSFESGEGKKLVEQAKLIQKLGEALKAKKFEKIKKIIDSESESSNSDKEAIEPRKSQTKKKRRVIVSDSSDDECLAERLGILNTSIDASDERPVVASNNLNEKLTKNAKASDRGALESSSEKRDVQTDDDKSTNVENDRLGNNEKIDIRLESNKLINNSVNIRDKNNDKGKMQVDEHDKVDRISQEKSKNTSGTEQLLDPNKNPSDMEPTVSSANGRVDEISDDKPKVKTKRRNSLEMLQEDIREMFISEGVVMATGYRMCRKKEASGINLNTSLGNFRKDETLSILDKKITEPQNSEADESIANNPKLKKTLKSNKSKTKNKKDVKRATPRSLRSKEPIPNSDSEEDQPLALRTEKLLNSTGNSVLDQEEDHDEELRKSKRVLRKDSVKEPRVVVEKTDIAKIDSSKVMFDSSSDESFGIDVSELAAAVDISPPVSNQEKPSDQDSSGGFAVASSKQQRIAKSNKCNTKQKKSSFIADDKNEDGISLTDDESATSDISMSSSTIVEKRTNGGSARTSTKEELLSNLLFGLVPTTTRRKSSIDKGSEADFDDDPVTVETSAKKTSVKKKKKKSSWQMGIVSTKKKKKKKTIASTASFKTTQTNAEETSEATTILTNTVEDINVAATEKTLTESAVDEHLVNADVDPVDISFENVKPLISTNSSDVNNTKLSDLAAVETSNVESFLELFSFEESKPIVKSEKEIEEAESTNNIVTAPSSDTDKMTTSFDHEKKSRKIVYDEIMEEMFRKISVNRLMDYVWTGQDKYKCLLCIFTGKNIVHHYKINHPGREVLIARLKSVDARAAMADAENDRTRPAGTTVTDEVCKFRCRFCCFVTEGAADVAIEAFYEHCTTHTGEYRFHCNSCPYQAVAKASMRTHYYKMCRKHNDTFSESASEDDVPREGGVYGYLCRECNYVQLKRSNVEAHVAFWHRNAKNIEILKINMSVMTTEVAVSCNEASQESMSLNIEKSFAVETKLELSEPENADGRNVGSEVDMRTRESQEDNGNISEECSSVHEPKTEESIQIKEEEIDEKSKVSQGENSENSVNTGNLSAFVCPPELENKEVEIQRERQKMMQEVANSILLKNFSKSDLSIIDKLQDKMRTDAVVNSSPECNAMQYDATSTLETVSPPLSVMYQTAESLESVNNMIIMEDPLCQSSSQASSSQEDRSSLIEEQSVGDRSAVADNVGGKVDTKIWDPLAIMDPCKKDDDESDGEISDNEHSAPVFESDSSSEQSDSETTDVNMILKETSNMNVSSSRDPMLTTIQRLAAQLQSAKPLESMPEMLESKMEIKCEFESLIPKPPDVVSIADAAHSQNAEPEQVSTSRSDFSLNPPKNFIRFRRLSGDMLSVPAQLSDDRENARAANADGTEVNSATDMLQTDTEEECSFLKIANVVSLAPRSDGSETESFIVNNIRKAVEISPAKNKILSLKKANQPLILKKVNVITQPLASSSAQGHMQSVTSEHLTLLPIKSLPASVSTKPATAHLRSTNFMPIAPKIIHSLDSNKVTFQSLSKTPVSSPITTRPIAVSSANPSSNVNYKIQFKMVRTPTVIKPKDPPASSVVITLKSIDAYTTMMKKPKLVHFYKCMSRDCHYTSDSLKLYGQHYHQHHEETSKQNNVPPHDFQKCAYCYMTLNDWTNMKSHLWEKHSHCRYQCAYCFYRAIVPSYVQQHQALHHAGNKLCFLMGKMIKLAQVREDVNRKDYTLPFVCNHDCGKAFYAFDTFVKHLKAKPASPSFSKHLYKCHLCTTTCGTIELLMSHYKLHGFSKYQCLYCLYGAETLSEVHQHLSSFHYDRLPHALERTLPSTSTRQLDVVEQLILRTFDDIKRYIINANEGSDDLNAAGSKKNTSIKNVTNDQISIASLNETVVASNFLEGINDSPSNAEIAANIPNTSAQQCKDSSLGAIIKNISNNAAEKQLLIINENKAFSQSEKTKLSEYATNQIFHEPELELLSSVNENAVDPLNCSSEFSCNDEFVNTNLLDNPEILKSFGINSDTSFKDSTAALEGKTDRTEDSDVEILENVESEKKIAEKRNVEDNKNQTMNPEPSRKNTEKSEQFVCNKAEDKCIPENTPTSFVDVGTQQEKPLTLDDIKDTGRTGLDLYKCGCPNCKFAAPNSSLLRTHMKECTIGMSIKNLFCAHCKKRFVKIGFLLEHLKAHGLKRFGCSQCKMRYAVSYQATAHMKTKHKFPNTKLVPADPTNPSVDGLFVVHAIPFDERKTKKRKGGKSGMDQEKEKMDNEKLSFNPDEIEQLPRQAIYNREIQCAMCPYTTKVRTNIIRHLQLHAKDETVPETGPVNPVPCLDKKEKMFDKMVNLASSSHQNGRMGGKKPNETVKETEQDNGIPKYVPEHKRYVCGVAECNYLTVDEAMLRYHLKALHSEEPYFRCPHCPPPISGQESQNIAIDKMGVHLKMHDTRLYKCSHCNHHHYHSVEMSPRHVVERHLTDKHPEKRPFVKVIRELDGTENSQQSSQEEAEEEVPDPNGNHWKCNLCDFKCIYKADISTHATTVHDENSQYKCTLCTFKTNAKILVEQHMSSKHVNDSNVDYITVYQKIKGISKRNAEATEQGGQEEPFDTTPLWTRSMPRIRHIRGILLEEEIESLTMNEAPVSSASKVSLGKRKSDVDVFTKSAKIKSTGKSASLDENSRQSNEKSKRSLSCEKLYGDGEGDEQATKKSAQSRISLHNVDAKSPKNLKVDATELSDVSDSDVGRFGPYGKPDGNLYICTLCNHFKTKYKHDMRDHLYRELNYARWHCKACGYLSVNRNALLQHFGKRHNTACAEHEPLSPDNAIEDWVMTLLKKQTDMIKAYQHANAPCKTIKTHGTSAEVDKTISMKAVEGNKKTVSLASTTTHLQNDLRDANRSNIDTDDGDSRDEELVIDMKEDEAFENRNNENELENEKSNKKTTEVLEKPLVCKHCRMKFTRLRGFKLHVQLSHLKRLFFLCPYCDRSTNSEVIMRQHIRSKHPNDPERIVPNPQSTWGSAKLTNEFWEKEYGLVFPLKTKKRKLMANDNSSDGGSINGANDGDGSGNSNGNGGDNGNGNGNGSGSGSGSGNGNGNDNDTNTDTGTGIGTGTGNDNCNDNDSVSDSGIGATTDTTTTSGNGNSKVGAGSGSSDRGKNITSDRMDVRENCCEICGFTAVNYTGLKSHMRMHAAPKHNLKCSYCTYSCSLKAELLEHWKYNHPLLPLKRQELPTTEFYETSKPSSSKKRDISIYDALDDVEEECMFNSNPVNMTYSCFYCNFRHKSLSYIKRHWIINHKEWKTSKNAPMISLPFKYKQIHLPISKLSSNNCVNENVIELPHDFVKRSKKCGWVCQWCEEFCETDEDRITHQNMFHSHLPQNFKQQEEQQQQQQEDQSKSTSAQAFAHNVEKHPSLTAKSEDVFNLNSVVENLMSQIERNETSDPRNKIGQSCASMSKEGSGRAVARKSTTRSALLYSRPGPRIFKAVARKSTNPLPKYRSSIFASRSATSQLVKTESEREETSSDQSYSHYGIPKSPVNLSNLSTYMIVGGHSMRVNCLTLATLININPKVILRDVRKDSRYAGIFCNSVSE
ncbi:uncharacterized protein LOC105286402 isoform X2 [Ooceraea biroi]|uniref:uncharacterized protein LOC105286402 isoform X2 n=1 Tax=Ooceraea biroi TaxID=2015173 RepID=UPI000F08E766|nr:uncharacterized protein LOC105286402 isoform X2 [Ooceraea biroi]